MTLLHFYIHMFLILYFCLIPITILTIILAHKFDSCLPSVLLFVFYTIVFFFCVFMIFYLDFIKGV